MGLKDTLEGDLKDAMRSGDVGRRAVIRLLRSAIHNEEIAGQSELDDDGVIQVLSKQAQQRRDSIEAFKKGNRQDLVDKEQFELDVIQTYLPEQLSRDELVEVIRAVIQDVGATSPADMGKVMGQTMPRVRGRAEGSEVRAIVSELLKGAAG